MEGWCKAKANPSQNLIWRSVHSWFGLSWCVSSLSQSLSSLHTALALLQEKGRAGSLFSKRDEYARFQFLRKNKHQVILMECTQQDRKYLILWC